VGASAELGKLIEVGCNEFYRRNQKMIDNLNSGWIKAEGLTTDYLDCTLFSTWW
jgi:hypothetical protein